MADETDPTTTTDAAADTTGSQPALAADPTQTRLIKELKHNRPLFSCRFDPTGRYVCAGAHDALIQRWDLADDQKLEFQGHESWVRGLAFQRGGELLVSGDYAGRLIARRYAGDSPESLLFSLEAHQGWIR